MSHIEHNTEPIPQRMVAATTTTSKLLVSIKEFEEMEKQGIQMEVTNPFIKSLLHLEKERVVKVIEEKLATINEYPLHNEFVKGEENALLELLSTIKEE